MSHAGEEDSSAESRIDPLGTGRASGPVSTPAMGEVTGPASAVEARHELQAAAAGSPLLRVSELTVEFAARGGWLRRGAAFRAVDAASIHVHAGETLAIVGESGSGKTTLARAVLGLIPASRGEIEFAGRPLFRSSGGGAVRGSAARTTPRGIGWPRGVRAEMQIIFQDPAGAMNPKQRVLEIIAEPLEIHGVPGRGGEGSSTSGGVRLKNSSRSEIRETVHELLDRVGLPRDAADRYPHEFSGGQRQRLVIARALATRPRLIVCDEPTSALDVSIQAQILNLLRDLQRDLSLALLFISHDFAVVRQIADRIAVMRSGRVVEQGRADDVISRPREGYTQRLVAAVPRIRTMATSVGERPA